MEGQSVTAQHNIIESLHASFQVKLQLACIVLANRVRSLHSVKFVDPLCDCVETLVF